MAFANLNTSAFAPLRSYADADIYFNNTREVRGYDKTLNGVPLRNDRKLHTAYSLRRLNDGSYACHMYHTDVLVFHKDGSLTLDVSYNTQSTHDFANRFLWGANGANTKFYVHTKNGIPLLSNHADGRCYPAHKPIILRPYNQSTPANPTETLYIDHVASNTEPYYVKRVHRAKGAQARKHIASLLAYARTMEAMGPLPIETVQSMVSDNDGVSIHSCGVHTALLHMSLDEIASPDNHAKIVGAFYFRTYKYNNPHLLSFKTKLFRDCVLAAAYKANDAYILEEVPLGGFHKDMKMRHSFHDMLA